MKKYSQNGLQVLSKCLPLYIININIMKMFLEAEVHCCILAVHQVARCSIDNLYTLIDKNELYDQVEK